MRKTKTNGSCDIHMGFSFLREIYKLLYEETQLYFGGFIMKKIVALVMEAQYNLKYRNLSKRIRKMEDLDDEEAMRLVEERAKLNKETKEKLDSLGIKYYSF